MKTIVITGASDGIGLESASQLAAQGHHVVLVGRTPAKLDAAVARIRRESPDVPVESFVCDFAVLADVRRLADRLLASYPRIDVLVDNAGTVNDKRTLTGDGFEATFAVNHLAGFLLTETLRDRLVESAPARVVVTASDSHYQGTMDLEDLEDLGYERGGYFVMRSYARSKLANVLYTRHLAAELAGTGVTVNAVHPGTVRTSIWRGTPTLFKPMIALAKLFMVSPEDGGARITYLATAAEIEGSTGGYYEKDRPQKPAELALDDVLAARLYDESRRLVGGVTSS